MLSLHILSTLHLFLFSTPYDLIITAIRIFRMPSQLENISILFDIRRLADAERTGNFSMGITVYTIEIFKRLSASPYFLNIDPFFLSLSTADHKSPTRLLRELNLLRLVYKRIKRKILFLQQQPVFAPSFFERLIFSPFFKFLLPFFGILPITSTMDLPYDILFSTGTPLPPRGSLNPSIKRVLTVNDVLHLKFPYLHPLPGRVPAIKHALDSIIPDRDFVICISECTKSDFLTYVHIPDSRIRVIYDGADDVFSKTLAYRSRNANVIEKLGLSSNAYVLALAQLEKRKNIETLVTAFSRMRREHDVSNLLILVANSRKSAIQAKKILIAHGLDSDAAKVLSNIDTSTLAVLYQHASIFSFLSLYEGFGIPLVEAMSSGCPILASNTSSIPEVLGNSGEMVNPNDISEISDRMYALLRDNTLRQQHRKRGFERAKLFTWSTTAEKTYQFFRYIAEFNY